MRIKGKGSVSRTEKKDRKNCRKWRIVFNTDKGAVPFRFQGTYSQACAERDRLYEELSGAPSECETFEEWADRWVALKEANPDYARSTVSKYRRQANVLKRGFGGMALGEITPTVAEETLLAIRHNDGDTLSGTYMNQIHTLMKQMMSAAEDEGLIERNPLARLKAPKIDTKRRKSLDRSQFARFVGMLSERPLDAHTMAVRLYVMGGLRRGEACAVAWRGIRPGIAVVDSSVDEFGCVKDPKTFAGFREVPLMAQLEEDLARWRKVQARRLAAVGAEQTPDTPVCATDAGGHMNPQNVDRWWREHRAEFGLEGYVLHELRHSFLTLVAANASLTTLKDIAGWSTIAMADTYVHTDRRANIEAVRSMEATVFQPN